MALSSYSSYALSEPGRSYNGVRSQFTTNADEHLQSPHRASDRRRRLRDRPVRLFQAQQPPCRRSVTAPETTPIAEPTIANRGRVHSPAGVLDQNAWNRTEDHVPQIGS